ncbi:peptidoglycan DD-metalloendopeptidase family protein [Epilithonimonas sp. JDS]|uniref:peptidoglycan DD-metalloendopeptidase family protein n=1 Tax=Epilithonimonas sp. JDS TaxID=2902797 RepID=UPI00293F2D1E|nr:peptidoglycan DD-metalloendopeptidase family protein [Epilithonimonas sp. JDS]
MKKNYLLFSVFGMLFLNAQNGQGFYQPSNSDCLSPQQRELIQEQINLNRESLRAQNKLQEDKTLAHPLFIWPVKKNPNTKYNNVWSISNHVDHNSAYPNKVQDWNCGARTYDTADGYNHMGIDIFTWPFGWYMMDNDQAHAIAAADGIIIGKDNGNYDRNCSFGNGDWNAVYIQHGDGSVSWYGHLKNNSLTSKGVGSFVSAGEYLGVVGSSGNSTGPHLHFEVYNNNNQLVDTYSGSCNTWSSSTDSWWASQKPYVDPKINGIFTHSDTAVFDNGCGTQETTNFKDSFNTGEKVMVYMYFADLPVGKSINLKLIRPDNTIAYNNTFNNSNFYYASYWYFTFQSSQFNQYGNWKASVTVDSETVTHDFVYGANMNVADSKVSKKFSVINPIMNNQLQIISKANFALDKTKMEIFSQDGKLIESKKIELKQGQNLIDVKLQKSQNYILKISDGTENEIFKVTN